VAPLGRRSALVGNGPSRAYPRPGGMNRSGESGGSDLRRVSGAGLLDDPLPADRGGYVPRRYPPEFRRKCSTWSPLPDRWRRSPPISASVPRWRPLSTEEFARTNQNILDRLRPWGGTRQLAGHRHASRPPPTIDNSGDTPAHDNPGDPSQTRRPALPPIIAAADILVLPCFNAATRTWPLSWTAASKIIKEPYQEPTATTIGRHLATTRSRTCSLTRP
jgi:hypothetical protein